MKKVQGVVQFFVGITVLALLVWVGYMLLAFVIKHISLVSEKATVVLIIGSVVIIWCAVIIAAGQRGASTLMNRSKDKEWKGKLYEEVTEMCLSTFITKNGNDDRKIDSTHLLDQLAKLEPQIALRGSNKVVRKYTEFKQQLVQSSPTYDHVVQKFMELLLVFRSDLESGKGLMLEIIDFQRLFGFNVEKKTTKKGKR